MPTISDHKRRAVAAIRFALPWSITVAVIYLVISAVVGEISTRASGTRAMTDAMLAAVLDPALRGTAGAQPYWEMLNPAGMALSFLLSLLISVVDTGIKWYYLRVSRGEKPRWTEIFNGFKQFTRVFLLQLIILIFVYLWSLLLIVPGIIAAFRYSQAPFIMLDRPELTPLECIRESSRMMRGFKVEYFVLTLSFIGWFILGQVVVYYTGYDLMQIWIYPYISMSYAMFYNHLSDRYVALPEE